MDLEKFRCLISDSGVDLWTWIDMAISMASIDHENELRNRRDGIVQKLYASTCLNCHNKRHNNNFHHQSDDEEDDDEKREILQIRNLLDDHTQDEKCLIQLLQRLVDMNTTFAALKETEIGRHVTKLRKHSSNEVRRLVKILVRKWKDTVDEWVKQNSRTEGATDFNEESVDNGVKTVSWYPTPTKRKAEGNGNGLSDEEFQDANKVRRPEMMNNISRLKNGGGVPVKYW